MVVSFGAVALKANNQNFALEGHDSHSSNSREPPDGRILLRKAAFCIGRSRFTSNGRILLRTPVFCFGRPRFASDSCILRLMAAFGIRQPQLTSDRNSFKKTKADKSILSVSPSEGRPLIHVTMSCVFFPSRWLFYIFKDQSPF